jgi:hypothetical protein
VLALVVVLLEGQLLVVLLEEQLEHRNSHS